MEYFSCFLQLPHRNGGFQRPCHRIVLFNGRTNLLTLDTVPQAKPTAFLSRMVLFQNIVATIRAFRVVPTRGITVMDPLLEHLRGHHCLSFRLIRAKSCSCTHPSFLSAYFF